MYTIEPLSEENLPQLITLYHKVFKKRVTLDYLRKKYNAAYLGHGYLGHLALFGNAPVAYYGAVPFQMIQDGQTEIATQSGDAMTLQGHTSKGLFTQLGEKTDQQLREAGITFVWGFPNQNSEYGYTKKLDWQYEHRMQSFHFPVKTFPHEALSRKVPLAAGLYKQRIDRFVRPIMSNGSFLESSVAVDGFAGTKRDQAFFHYKDFSDNFIIELSGKKVWIKVNFGLWVGDLEIMSETTFDIVLEALKTLAGKLGLKEVAFQFSPGTYYGNLLSQKFEARETWVAGYKDYNSSFSLENLKFSWGDLDTF